MSDDRRRRSDDAYAPTIATPGSLEGSTLPHDSAPAHGTIDLPASDQVEAGASLDPGGKIGHFVIRRTLGQGGMGIVVAAHDPDLGREVAIKLVRADAEHPAYRARLRREGQAMARLEHPHVVRVYEVGVDRGRLFIAMELVNGVTLSAWLQVQRRSWRQVVAMFEQVGAGLAAIHRAGLVHRDFKPDNVLVDRDGHARVADLGLARLDPASASSAPEEVRLTRTGAMIGTPGYMAPEQQYGSDVDARADQYSFCVALREALLGGRLVKEDDAAWSGIPRDVRAIVTRGMSIEASERFTSMDELLVMLARAGNRRRTALGAVIASGVIAASLVGAIVVSHRDHAAAPEADALAAVAPIALPRAVDALLVETVATHDAALVEVVAVMPHADAPPVAVGGSSATHANRAASSPTTHAPVAHDAGVVPVPVPVVDAQVIAGAVPGAPGGPPATLVAWSRRSGLPAAADPHDPGHAAVVRATIRGLGYDGFDPKATLGEATGIDLAIAKIQLGMIARRHDDCARATSLFEDGVAALQPDLEPIWQARAVLSLALCQLAAGHVADAEATVHRAWRDGNREEISFVMALTRYELGDLDVAYGMVLSSTRSKSPAIRDAIQAWAAGTGLTVP